MLMWWMLACGLLTDGASSPVVDDPIAAMRTAPLTLTRHARCRMDCRHIDRAEVEHVLATGRLEPGRSRNDGRCPSHALQGRDSDGGPVRIVFAACADETRVVTAIDLDDDFPCDCR